MIKVLAFIGLMSIVVIIGAVCGILLALLTDKDEIKEREKWSRTLEEPDTGNEDFKKHIMDRFMRKD